jgi:hypothetical protein
MIRVDGEVLSAPLTKPAQPLMNAAAQLRTTALTARVNAFAFNFNFFYPSKQIR